jgi:hypothetical protein
MMKNSFKNIVFQKRIILLFGVIIFLSISFQVSAQDTIKKHDKKTKIKPDKKSDDTIVNILENDESKEQKIEKIAENTDNELDNTDAEELRKTSLLSDIQINNLLDHIKKNGKLISIYELQTVNDFDVETINRILPYVYVSFDEKQRYFSFKEMINNGSNQVFIRYQRTLEEKTGFSEISDSALAASPNSRYVGTPERLFLKYRFTYYNNISWGITAEKDPGEVLLKKDTIKGGFDFYSAHFFMRDFGILKSLAIGDYSLQFGQGLTLWSGLGFGKSSDVAGIKKNALGIKPYTSVDENLFMRGAAATIGLKGFELCTFFSRNKKDANILSADSLNQEILYVSSLQETGYHTTPSELHDKDAITETLYGSHLGFRNKKLSIGATAYKTVFSANLQRDLQLYSQFEFSSKENFNTGVDYSYTFRNFNFFGEVSRSENGGMAYLNGLLMSLDAKVSMSLMHRKYEKDYQVLYSSAFAENSKVANEEAIYLGIVLKPINYWTLSAYADNFKFPWLKYRTDAPSKGFDYLTQLNYKPSKKMELYLRFRQENKEINNSSTANIIDYTEGTVKQSVRFNAAYVVSSSFTLKSRIEVAKYTVGNASSQNGFLIYQDVSFKSMKSPVSCSVRYCIFDTDSYDSRVYAYESEVLYAYSIPSFYYKGSRAYVLLKYRFNRHIDVWLRLAQTYYANQNVIGSGLTEIKGNKKTDLSAQVRFKF